MFKLKSPGFFKNILRDYVFPVISSPFFVGSSIGYMVFTVPIFVIITIEGLTYTGVKYRLNTIGYHPVTVTYTESYDRCSVLNGDIISSAVNALPALYFDWSVSCEQHTKEYDVLNGQRLVLSDIDSVKAILSADTNIKLSEYEDNNSQIIEINPGN